MSLKYTYILSHKLMHMIWSQGSCIFRIRSVLDGKCRYFFISAPWLYIVDGCLIYIGVNVVFVCHTYITCTHTDRGLCLKCCTVICWRVPLCGKLRDTDLRQATARTRVLISHYPDQEGNKLQRQKILMFIYPIYNHNWRNTSAIYIYIYIYIYTGCPRRNVPDFGRVFLILKYTDITQNTYVKSWTVKEIMAREVWNFDSCYTLIDYQIHIKTGRNMWCL